MKNILKYLLDCLPFGKPRKYLAMNNELVRRMDTEQKFNYAINACDLALHLWGNVFEQNRTSYKFICLVKRFVTTQAKIYVTDIGQYGIYFCAIASGTTKPYISEPPRNIDVANYPSKIVIELGYTFWSLQRMLALAYPKHGFKLEAVATNRCDDDEALSRIASSIVSSVAVAYGHAHGLRRHNKVYGQMLNYGKELLKEDK